MPHFYHDPIFLDASHLQELDDIWALLTGAAMDMAMAEAGGSRMGWHARFHTPTRRLTWVLLVVFQQKQSLAQPQFRRFHFFFTIVDP